MKIRMLAEKVETYDDFHRAPDAILDMRMPDVLREIALQEETRDALLGKVNALRDIFELVLHYEPGYWEKIGSAAIRLGVSEDAVPALYLESVDRAQQILSGRTEAESRPA